MVELPLCKRWVGGSIPLSGSNSCQGCLVLQINKVQIWGTPACLAVSRLPRGIKSNSVQINAKPVFVTGSFCLIGKTERHLETLE